MWRLLLAGSEWGRLLDLVSPSFFAVVSAWDMERAVRHLAGSALRKREAAALRRTCGERFARDGVPIVVPGARPDGGQTTAADGAAILHAYFHQLFTAETLLLDLRRSRFHVAVSDAGERTVSWYPSSLHATLAPEFVAALRELYVGCYDGDRARFSAAARALGVGPAEDLLAAYFGDQRALVFDLSEFRGTFHAAFERCAAARGRLHPDFIPFGVHLSLLYEHLEAVGGQHDVLAAFRAATARPPATSQPAPGAGVEPGGRAPAA